MDRLLIPSLLMRKFYVELVLLSMTADVEALELFGELTGHVCMTE